ncbi:MAG: hypothetical protein QXK89_01480 [Candidatus Bathyarchaeia archaeon]
MGLFEELYSKYPVEDVPPLGSCLIIPAGEFRREWEARLKSEGCKVYTQAHGGQVCFFVKPPNKQEAGGKQEAQPKPKIVWTPELIEQLKMLRLSGLGHRAIARELKLSPHAVYRKLKSLGLSGLEKTPKPETSSDGLLELIESLKLLHEHGYRRTCVILLQNAKSFLEEI